MEPSILLDQKRDLEPGARRTRTERGETGIATNRAIGRYERNQDATFGAPGLTTRSKKPLGAPGLATRSKDANRTEGSVPRKKDLPNTRRRSPEDERDTEARKR